MGRTVNDRLHRIAILYKWDARSFKYLKRKRGELMKVRVKRTVSAIDHCGEHNPIRFEQKERKMKDFDCQCTRAVAGVIRYIQSRETRHGNYRSDVVFL